MKRLAPALVLLLLVPLSTRAQEPDRYEGPIIDMHLHAYLPEIFWGPAPNPATGEPSVGTAEEHRTRSLEVMRRHRVVLGAVSGEGWEAADAWRSAAPERVLRGVILEEPEEFMSPDRLRELAEAGELEVLGEVGAQYVGRSPSDPDYEPFWSIAETHDVPVAIHTGASFPGTPYDCCPEFRLRYGNPLLMEDMLVAHPDLRVTMMHAGLPYQREALAMTVMYPQLYTDIGVLSWIPGAEAYLEGFLREARAMGLLDRLMFGSDQMVWPEAIGMAVERVQALDLLTPEEKAGIFYDNAARFLELSEETIARHHDRPSGTGDELR